MLVVPAGGTPSGQWSGGRCPVSRTKVAYAAFVTGVAEISIRRMYWSAQIQEGAACDGLP